jgi:hypothetical protein
VKYLRLFREFVEVKKDKDVELSKTTIDDVLKKDFFDKEKGFTIDSRGVYHIKNWKVY